MPTRTKLEDSRFAANLDQQTISQLRDDLETARVFIAHVRENGDADHTICYKADDILQRIGEPDAHSYIR